VVGAVAFMGWFLALIPLCFPERNSIIKTPPPVGGGVAEDSLDTDALWD
jgi:hypothetical protein